MTFNREINIKRRDVLTLNRESGVRERILQASTFCGRLSQFISILFEASGCDSISDLSIYMNLHFFDDYVPLLVYSIRFI